MHTGVCRTSAEEFAEACKEDWSLEAFRVFEKVFQFAKSSMKLPRDESQGFAFEWMARDDWENFAQYRDGYEFAVSKMGFNLRPSEARAWVKEFDDQPGMEFIYRFCQAFEVARESGQSRSKAEDFAFENLLSGSG